MGLFERIQNAARALELRFGPKPGEVWDSANGVLPAEKDLGVAVLPEFDRVSAADPLLPTRLVGYKVHVRQGDELTRTVIPPAARAELLEDFERQVAEEGKVTRIPDLGSVADQWEYP